GPAGSAAPTPPTPPLTAQTFPLTHLWFLYVLSFCYLAALVLRGLEVAIDPKGAIRARLVDPIVRGLVKSHLAQAVLAAPIAIALYLKPDWYAWFGVPTPDTGLLPNTPALITFGLAFGAGWLINRQADLLGVWERNWQLNLGGAIILTAACLAL